MVKGIIATLKQIFKNKEKTKMAEIKKPSLKQVKPTLKKSSV
jgi:hypothetical protein